MGADDTDIHEGCRFVIVSRSSPSAYRPHHGCSSHPSTSQPLTSRSPLLFSPAHPPDLLSPCLLALVLSCSPRSTPRPLARVVHVSLRIVRVAHTPARHAHIFRSTPLSPALLTRSSVNPTLGTARARLSPSAHAPAFACDPNSRAHVLSIPRLPPTQYPQTPRPSELTSTLPLLSSCAHAHHFDATHIRS